MVNMMTDEEADVLDELYTKTIPPLRTGEGGPFTRRRELMRSIDQTAVKYIINPAEVTKQAPAQIIGKMVRHEIAARA